jgi:S-adenosylmethionine/arginine decarboxylase-like enzyme
MHLIVDAYNVWGELQSDYYGILKWLDELPGKVGMRILRKAVLCKDGPPKCLEIDAGITGDVILAESHATIHCWPERHELQFDLYSCKPFDPEFVLGELIGAFGVGECDVKVIPRRTRI